MNATLTKSEFRDLYVTELERAMTYYPDEYGGMSPSLAAANVDKMIAAMVANRYSNKGRAIKAVCKKLGIKNTFTEIDKFIVPILTESEG